jgi:endonuclease/exonuclease/phosphatase family metal-dependent hydrolase
VRGWAAISAELDGKALRFVSAHLDADAVAQREQARQLAGLIRPDVATLLVGNLAPESTPAYRTLFEGPIEVDLPGLAGGGVPSCCRDAALVDPAARLDRREDFVLGTAHFHPSWGSWAQGNGAAMVSGLWPSSHAGIAAGVWLE